MNGDNRNLNSHMRQLSDGQMYGHLYRLYKAAPRLKTITIEDDGEFRKHVRHVLKSGEALGTFVARTGLGRSQALSFSKAEVTRFVEQVERNRANEPAPPPIFSAGVATKPQGVIGAVMVG